MLAVTEIAMLTPLGNAEQTVAGVAAGINMYQESVFINRNHQAMKTCEIPEDALPELPEEYLKLQLSPRRQRIIRLAIAGLADLLEKMTPESKIPLLLLVPEKMHGLRTPIDDRYFKLILSPFAEKLDLENSFIFPFGRASLAKALDAANYMLEDGKFRKVIVGGVDSHRDPHLLEILDSEGRVLAEGVLDGFAPGEASSFMVLEQANQDKTNSKAIIVDWAEASEQGHRYAQEAYLGEALATATTNALKKVPKESVSSLYANLNGESFFAKEWGITQLRNSSWFSEAIEVNHPADCFGDLGAAMGPVQIALIAGQKSASQMHLLCLSSELDTRSAIVLKTFSTRLS